MKRYYAFISTEEVFNLQKDFYIVNCGYDNLNEHSIHYKRLRSDFYLLMVTQGQVIHRAHGKRYTIKAGEMFLYYPNEPQEYYVSGKNDETWYWVHFSGTKAINFIKTLGLQPGPIYPADTNKILKLYNKILNEYKARDVFYEEVAVNYLYELLFILARNKYQYSSKKAFAAVIEQMTISPKISNEECAKICCCSTVHFVRLFKKVYGTTPHKYKQKIIINQMKELLLTTNKTIGAISEILGFEANPLSANKLFKKATGMTPTEFRRKNKHYNKKSL